MAHGKSPGWIGGDHWFTCDVCGFDYRASTGKHRWDKMWVCQADWEARQPQDFVRGRKDKITPNNPIRPVPAEDFVDAICGSTTAIADFAMADCAIVDSMVESPNSIPTGSFGDYLEGTIVGDNFAEPDVLE